jgi:hypothetical protein
MCMVSVVCCQVEFTAKADPSTREVLASMAYLSVIETRQRGGLSSMTIQEQQAILQQHLFVYTWCV